MGLFLNFIGRDGGCKRQAAAKRFRDGHDIRRDAKLRGGEFMADPPERGLGFIENVEDIEYSVVATNDNVPIYIKDVANVTLGPALRRGALDKGGAEAVGGISGRKVIRTIDLMLLKPYFHGTTRRNGAPFWFGITSP